MTRRICVVTGSRAEYGLLRWVMQNIKDDPGLTLQIIATGMHLSPRFGLTYREIEQDGFKIDHKVEMLGGADTPTDIANSMAAGLSGCAAALNDLRPDLVVVLGDRFEIFSAAMAACVGRIPVAHLHGGETTLGAIDEAFRHSITKMSQLHFVAAEEYRRRVIQLGENPDHVFQVGALGIDNIRLLKLLSRNELEVALDWKLGNKNLLVTFHPVTLEDGTAADQFTELLIALAELRDTKIIFTMPNADTDHQVIVKMIREFVATHDNARAYLSLGQLRYLSCLKHVDGVVGNSSSGLIEAPSMGIGTINIGDRQHGRLKAESVIDCFPNSNSIASALYRLYSPDFQNSLKHVRNPYGNGGASETIVQLLREVSLRSILKKSFYDLNYSLKSEE